MMDAYIVGVRRSAFLEAAPNVAQFVEYTEALVSHLQEKTLKHPDRQMRELAAMSLGKILAGSKRKLQELEAELLGDDPYGFLSSKAPKPLKVYNHAIVANGFVYCSGQVPMDPSTMKLVDGDIQVHTVSLLGAYLV